MWYVPFLTDIIAIPSMTISIFLSSLLIITVLYKSLKDLNKTVIINKEDKKIDIVIEGMAMISVKKGTYHIYTLKGVNVFTRDAMI